MRNLIVFFTMICFLILPVAQADAVEFTSEREKVKPDQIQYSEAEEAELIKELKVIIEQLEVAGIKKEFLDNLIISVFPAENINIKTGEKFIKYNAYFTDEVSPKIVVAMLNKADLAPTLCHEIGHMVESMLFQNVGYDWTNTGLIGQVYMESRGYNKDIPLDHNAQVQLDWYDRVSEWWAEDLKMQLMSAIDENYIRTRKVGNIIEIEPEIAPETNLLMNYILFEGVINMSRGDI